MATAEIFMSFRIRETLPLAEALKVELEKKGISTFVCAVPVGESIAKQITTNLMNCKLAVILGSETYGMQTESSFSTYDELTAIRDHKIPFFLVKTCAEFKESHAKFFLPPSIAHYPMKIDLENPKHVPADLVPQIMARLNEVKADKVAAPMAALKLETHGAAPVAAPETSKLTPTSSSVDDDLVAKLQAAQESADDEAVFALMKIYGATHARVALKICEIFAGPMYFNYEKKRNALNELLLTWVDKDPVRDLIYFEN